MTFRLRVEGACLVPLVLGWDEIDEMAYDAALVANTAQLSNRVRGEGVRLAALLARAQPLPAVTHVMVHDDGEYRACLTLAEATTAAVLAHRADGAPLPEAQGGPVRLLLPTSDNACLSVKRVCRVELLTRAEVDTVPRPTTPLRPR
jgi:DMSO/TMAO reductase YedYZ molybdopterin-dependent catalytic subunit